MCNAPAQVHCVLQADLDAQGSRAGVQPSAAGPQLPICILSARQLNSCLTQRVSHVRSLLQADLDAQGSRAGA